jgi:hypothetical protein
MNKLILILSLCALPVMAQEPAAKETKRKVIYQENQTLDFEGLSLEGELKTPGEFYFQNRNQERFDTLSKRRLNFRREMLRDSVQSN